MKNAVAAIALALAVPTVAQTSSTAPAPGAGATSVDYSNDETWLCLPGRPDPCGQPLTTAELQPDGFGPVTQETPAANPAFDCFYVYPTMSRDPGMNSDMTPGIEEQGATAVQFARFSTVCRTFAPIYRQATVASLLAVATGRDPAPIINAAYEDVKAAWRQFLSTRNQGRPYVLIGHSQGTVHLNRLIAEEIEGRPEAARMLSAILLGFNVEVPEGQAVGGTFRQTPLCQRAGQTGCVITYVSFRADAPPPAGALFGRAATPGRTVACTNPAAFRSGDHANLDSYWFALPGATTPRSVTWSASGEPPAPFLHTSDLVSARCVNDGPLGYLAVTVNADPNDARTDTIPGEVQMAGEPLPGWGIHLVDVNLAQGDLIRVVAAQAEAFARR